MSTKKSPSLGRGLGALMGDLSVPTSESEVEQVIQDAQKESSGGALNQIGESKYFECPIEDIIPNPNQPRKLFPKEELTELAASIEEKGIIQPIVVRSIGGGKYEIIAGERRFRG